MKKAIGIAFLAFAPAFALAQTATLQHPSSVQHPLTAQAPTVAPHAAPRLVVTAGSKEQYKQAQAEALSHYKTARAQCDSLAGNLKDVCVAQAKAERVRADEDATAQYKNTVAAFTRARMSSLSSTCRILGVIRISSTSKLQRLALSKSDFVQYLIVSTADGA